MGRCFVVDGKYDEAVKMHTVVVQWREQTLGTLEPPTLDAYNNLGEALYWKGDWYAAERFLQQALKGWRDIHGAKYPSTLTSMANLASTYRNQGRWEEAEELIVQVMETSSKVLGIEHHNTLSSINSLTLTSRNQDR